MKLTEDDLRYEENPTKCIDEARVETLRQKEEGEISEEEAEEDMEELDLLQSKYDEKRLRDPEDPPPDQ